MKIHLFCYVFFFRNSNLIKKIDYNFSLMSKNHSKSDNESINKKKLLSPIIMGVNYAYPYENSSIINDIYKNLYIMEQKNSLLDKSLSNNIKLKIAKEYLLINNTNYKVNVTNGGLFDDWLFKF